VTSAPPPERRRFNGLLFIALAGVLAWGGTVPAHKSAIRWLFVVLLGAWGIMSLLGDRIPWLRERERSEPVYIQMAALGIAVAAVGWFIPGAGSQALFWTGGLLALVSIALLLRFRLVRKPDHDDDPNRPR
jgi:hypothetical protein